MSSSEQGRMKSSPGASVKAALLSGEIVEAFPDAMVIVKQDGTVVQANAQAEEMFGYQRQELLGQKIELLVPERFRRTHHHDRQEFTQNPKTRRMGAGLDLYGRRKDGSEFPVEISLSPITVEDGILVLSAIRDISDRKRIEEELRRAHRELDQRTAQELGEYRGRLAAIVDSSEDAILSKKLDGTITSWNAGAERLYGWMAEEIIGRSLYEIVPEDRREELRSILDRLASGLRIEHLETMRIRRDGTLVEVELTVSPLKNEYGKVVEASAIARDITQRKQLERSLHQLSIRILQAQDEERRRIARELHDSTVQKLALLSMNLAQLPKAKDAERAQATLQNSQALTAECVQELRTLSYVLHPPMLDELGLASALKIYVEGVAQRSGIAIDAEIDSDWQRLSPEIEMALFRVSQEGLGNVLRHSGSKTAKISLLNRGGIVMKISDQGKGMAVSAGHFDGEVTVGVGIPGMNERIRQLGGTLSIDSSPSGTTITVRIPATKAVYA